MSKAHRGKGLASEYKNGGRGECPKCHRTGIKIIHEIMENDKKMLICKECNAAIKNKKSKAG
jgi:hypothetical protein